MFVTFQERQTVSVAIVDGSGSVTSGEPGRSLSLGVARRLGETAWRDVLSRWRGETARRDGEARMPDRERERSMGCRQSDRERQMREEREKTN